MAGRSCQSVLRSLGGGPVSWLRPTLLSWFISCKRSLYLKGRRLSPRSLRNYSLWSNMTPGSTIAQSFGSSQIGGL